MTKLLLWVLTLTPRDAAKFVEPKLEPICHRETRCTAKGIHKIDGWLGKRAWQYAMRAKILDANCPFHALGDNPSRWSTSGPFGMLRAYSIQYLPKPLQCLPPEVLDIPIVAAYVAKRRFEAAHRRGATRALRRWANLAPYKPPHERLVRPELRASKT